MEGNKMANITVEQVHGVTIVQISGKLTFEETIDTIKNYYHMATRHIIWDFTDEDATPITPDQFRKIISTANEYLPFKEGGKTAYVSTADNTSGMTRMFSVLAEFSGISYPYGAFRDFEEAVEWLHSPTYYIQPPSGNFG
jgi:hypothetical protein